MSSTFQMRVQSPSTLIDMSPSMATIRYTEYMHDALSFLVPSQVHTRQNPYVTGTPISMHWSAVPTRGFFYGYIDTVAGNLVTCVGATYPFKNEDQLSYRDMSADAVIDVIAEKHRFACLKQTSSTVWSTLAQGGKSDWAFIVDLAKKVGYTLYAHDTCIVAVDRQLALATAPTVNYIISTNPQSHYEALKFAPVISSGDGVDGHPGSYIVRGKSAFSGNDFQTPGSSNNRFQRIVSAGASSIAEAQANVAAAESLNQFTMRARMTVRGNPTLRTGIGINLSFVDGNQIHKGLWYVIDVEHKLVGRAYTTDVEMVKTTAGTMVVNNIPSGLVVRGPLPATVFNGDRWSAAWRKKAS